MSSELFNWIFSIEDSDTATRLLPSIFLFGIWTETGSNIFLGLSILGFLSAATLEVYMGKIFREIEGGFEDIKEGFRLAKEQILDSSRKTQIILISFGFSHTLTELAALLAGVIMIFSKNIPNSKLLSIIWVLFIYTNYKQQLKAIIYGFREFIIPLQHEMPGQDFFNKEK